jgi:hypothetical protein
MIARHVLTIDTDVHADVSLFVQVSAGVVELRSCNL